VDEPKEELDEWPLALVGDELVSCDEMRAAAMTVSPTEIAQKTGKKFPAARAFFLLPTSNLITTERLWFKA
jgi:hypothetical protein